MQNAPASGTVYLQDLPADIYTRVPLQDLALDPQRIHDYLFGNFSYLSAGLLPFAAAPSGEIRLVPRVPLADDPKVAQAQQRAVNWLRVQSQHLIQASDGRALVKQERLFSLFTRILMWQRGFETFLREPVWRKFASREVIETAEHLYERHGEVRLRINIASAEFDLCGPSNRARQHCDEIRVSLRPVVDALLIEGLWLDRPDERFRDLARMMVRLGRSEHRCVGPQFSRGEQ